MRRIWTITASLALAMTIGPLAAEAAPAKPKALKIAIVTFFSGSGAVVGGPTVNSAKLAIAAINKAGGVDGVPVAVRYVDESGGPTKQVAEFRSVAGKVAAVLGYASSADCLAVEPVAESLHALTIFSDCNSNALYKGPANEWIFHTIPPASANALAMALYVAKTHRGLKTIAGLNPDYAFGRDEWKYFTMAMGKLDPSAKIGTALFPALFSGHYSSELSRLQSEQPSLVYSSLWGGDVVALIQQGAAQGAFQQSLFALPVGTQGGNQAMRALPNGVVVGAEHGYLMHPGKIANARLAAFVAAYHKQFGSYPVAPYPYTIQRAILALKAGYEAAMKSNGGKWPTLAEVSHALVGVKVTTAQGKFQMRSDHVAEVGEMDGISVHTAKYPFAVFNDVVRFPPSMIMAPVGESNSAWIEKLTPAALAKVPAPNKYKP